MNSTDRIAAERYAGAYNALSAQPQDAVVLAQQLTAAAQTLASVKMYMTSPRVSLQAKKQLILSAFGSSQKTASFLVLLLETKRYRLLDSIVSRVNELADERQGILRATVVSARPLTAGQQEEAQQALSSRYGKTVKAVFHTDEKLLGGIKIYCQNELIDGSLQHRLQKLQEELIK
jgi:F-type H+-transporting ATPase subunit delta